MELQPSRLVAKTLARVWSWHRTPQFLDYVAESFNVRVSDTAAFDALYIHQVAEGDLQQGVFYHWSTFQWWEVTDGGIQECGRPEAKHGWWEEKLRGSFYRWPHISFLHAGGQVGFGECFGPKMLNRKVGEVAGGSNGPELTNIRVVWR